MYIVTRKDLSAGTQACQAMHAMIQFYHDYPEIEKKWYMESNYIVLLAVDNVSELENYISLACQKDIKYSCFFEPDLKNDLTAVAFEPIIETKKLLSKLKLAYRNK